MSQVKWTAVDSYFSDQFLEDDAMLQTTLQDSINAGLPDINVAPNQGKFLMLLAQMQGARTILEIGTLGAYSTIWLARALPADGKIITLEYDTHHAEIAKKNIARAGFADQVTIIVGNARETLPTLVDDAPFDFIFIDADKPNNPFYYDWSVKLSRSGTVIFADNVVRDGEVANPNSSDEKVIGTQQMSDLIANDARVEATAIQTVGSKGYDGFALIRVK
ncbi:MAG: O-methyltransferase [Phototrophicaceae bacterium]